MSLENPLWDMSEAALVQLFHAHAVRNGARLRWKFWQDATPEMLAAFDDIANREVVIEGF